MIEKVFRADVNELQNVLDFVDEELSKYDCPMSISMQFAVCTEEMFVNVASYSYIDKTGDVTIKADCIDGVFSLTFEDEGIKFNPLAKDDPDITLSAEQRQIGGLGIFMVKKSMDEVNYEYSNNKNIFTMKKRLQ